MSEKRTAEEIALEIVQTFLKGDALSSDPFVSVIAQALRDFGRESRIEEAERFLHSLDSEMQGTIREVELRIKELRDAK